METHQLSDIFSLFHNINSDILERFLGISQEEKYDSEEIIIDQESWGRAIYFIVSGWLKIETVLEDNHITLEIIGRGGFVGEEGILSNNAIDSRVIAISSVELLSVSAQRFIQFLYQNNQIQNRLLSMTVDKVKEYQRYCQFYRQSAKARLANVLIDLAEKYGEVKEKGVEIYNFSGEDLANLAQVSLAECTKVFHYLEQKDLILVEPNHQSMYLTNLKMLHHVMGKLGNS